MKSVRIGSVVVQAEPDITAKIYASIGAGGSEKCGCAHCRNFRVQLPGLFPEEVRAFFAEVGIDPTKDAEVYDLGEGEQGKRCCQGEYYFVSGPGLPETMEKLPSGLQFGLCSGAGPLAQPEFANVHGVACFQFTHDIPWVLEESP